MLQEETTAETAKEEESTTEAETEEATEEAAEEEEEEEEEEDDEEEIVDPKEKFEEGESPYHCDPAIGHTTGLKDTDRRVSVCPYRVP